MTNKNAAAPDLSVTIAGLRLQNPVIAASGTFGYGREYAGIIDVSRLGGICTKGLTLNPRAGNTGIRLWETPAGLLNSIGLENPGIAAFIENELPHLRTLGPAVIANLSGSTVEEYAEGAALLNASSVDMIELNISCPNVKAGGMTFGLEPEAAASVVAPVRRALTGKPLMVKLSPNAPDLAAVARACINAGADALSLVNTFKAMAIDIQKRKPVFDNISAGLSGPAIKPIALRMVWELCRELQPTVPIVGFGGIAGTDDALEFLMAGAAAIQVGSATFAHPAAMIEIIDGIENYMRRSSIAKLEDIAIPYMGTQATLFDTISPANIRKDSKLPQNIASIDFFEALSEDEKYLTEQIITYIGNKRSLLQFITKGIQIVQKRLNKNKLIIFDVFSGSGIVARHFKQYSKLLLVNDLEKYSKITNECYLSNKDEINISHLKKTYYDLINNITSIPLTEGIITKLYSPEDDNNIKIGERVFYTRRNAMYIDTMRNLIEGINIDYKKYFLAPLLAEASVHSNTSGVFKGFYKNKETGIGQFGGSNSDALFRIKSEIVLPFPLFSNFSCNSIVYNGDSNEIIKEAQEVDLAYLDPPYNQHPYGSNYFMLNLILENKYPENMSKVSGIPENWNRSSYNKKQFALNSLTELVSNIKAKYVLISFNSEGFITLDEMKNMLQKTGKVEILETSYNTFRGCRNLANRDIHVKEYLYLLEK